MPPNDWLVFDPTGQADLNRREASSALFNTLVGIEKIKSQKKYTNKLNSILSSGDYSGSPAEAKETKPSGSSDLVSLPDRLIGSGFLKEGQDLGAYQQAREQSDLEATDKRIKLAGQSFGWLKENATPENAHRVLNSLVSSKLISKQTANGYMDEIKQDPSLVRQLAEFGYSSSLSGAEQLPKYETINTGADTRIAEINPITGNIKEAASFKNSESPNAILGATVSRRGQDLDYQSTLRGQNLSSDNASKAADISKYVKDFELTSALRKEWEALEEVKKYKNAISGYNSLKSAFQRNTPQSDIDIIYAIAKIYDPESVVREGEYATIRNSQSIPDSIKSAFAHVWGNGRLTKDTREQLRDEAVGRLNAYRNESNRATYFISNVARKNGLDDRSIVDDSLRTNAFSGRDWELKKEENE